MNLADLEEKFVATLEYPEAISGDKQYVLCVAAAIGSGKSTVMSHLAKELGLVYVRSDALRLVFLEADIIYDSESLGSILRNVFSMLLEKGYSIALDLNAGSQRAKKLLNDMEQGLDFESFWLTFDISEAEAERRIRGRENIIHGEAEKAILNRREQIAKGVEYVKPPKPAVYIFTENESLSVQLEKCIIAIRRMIKQV